MNTVGAKFNREESDDNLRLDALAGTHIDFYQDIPPVPAGRDAIVQAALTDMAQQSQLGRQLRSHRYGGTDKDRHFAKQWISQRLPFAPEDGRVLLTQGTQSALIMLLPRLLGPDGVLFTEALTYPSIKKICDLLRIQVQGIAMDDDGILPEALDFAARRQRPQALYCMPTVHNPTTISMSDGRKQAIVEVARRHRIAILEDDAYGLFGTEAALPLAATAPDITWYIHTVAKSIGLQLRIAIVVGPGEAAVNRCFAPTLRMTHWMAAPISAELFAVLADTGKARQLFEAILFEARTRQEIAGKLLPAGRFRSSAHSLHLWLDVPPKSSIPSFVQSARDNGVLVGGPDAFAVGPEPCPHSVRVCLGAPEDRKAVAAGLQSLAALL